MTRSMLLDILEKSSAQAVLSAPSKIERGLALDITYFPFLAIVGQREMRTALLLAVINPRVGGVLLIGPRGTAKTTAVRGLVDLMPPVRRSTCPYGCTEKAAQARGPDAICPDCAAKMARGEPLTALDRMRLVELPLHARLEDVVGGINERVAIEQNRVLLERGILSRANDNLLYVDEINLLEDHVVNAILDASAQGHYTVRRGPLSATYNARFVLIGSMNPEEGRLRPQIMDRLGLRVMVSGLKTTAGRQEVYRRMRAFADDPHQLVAIYAADTLRFGQEIASAKARLSQVTLTRTAERLALRLVQELEIDSNRAEFVTLEAARAHAAADGRSRAGVADVRAVAPMALRQRGSQFMTHYLEQQAEEEKHIRAMLQSGKS
ncbi:MAG: ATP-binding protein [Chloroflexota bacterium]